MLRFRFAAVWVPPAMVLLRGMMAIVACSALGTASVWAGHANEPKGSQGASGHPKNDFVIPMNYELGMHCTGFEFAYCCVLPPYNSILAQVIKTEGAGLKQPLILEGDPNVGKDAVLQRETVVRDPELGDDDNFKKYVIRYRHEAQPRNDGRGKAQGDPLISAVELNSLFMWNTVYDRTTENPNGTLKTGTYNDSINVPVGDGVFDENDNYASGWLNHLYIYSSPGPDGHPNLEGEGATGVDNEKIRLGIDVPIPVDCGPSGQPMGPVTAGGVPNNCGGLANGNVLAFSTDTGSIVYTKANVLDDLPIMLTSPRIWEALGLPLTPFEDGIKFFGNPADGDGPGSVDEDSIRPYVKMIAELEHFGTGQPVLDSKGNPVTAFGTAPIDIPNCERCHSELDPNSFNSAQNAVRNPEVAALVQEEIDFWKAYYAIDDTVLPDGSTVDSTWYTRLKGAAISILAIHDNEHGTGFTDFYPAVECVDPDNCLLGPLTEPVSRCTAGDDDKLGQICEDNGFCGTGGVCSPSVGALLDAGDPRVGMPQNTRLGHESVICQKCHADNVIAVVKGASCGPDSGSPDNPCPENQLIPPVTEAIHNNHTNISEGGDISFTDSLGRDGGCQGCHPAHRSDGVMTEVGPDRYPISIEGDNAYQNSDNRLAAGGCFVGRDVHSNIYKDTDGAETPEHLNAVGQWLSSYVFNNQGGEPGGNQSTRGIWCTNCHTQLSQEIWKAEDCDDLINADCVDGYDIRNAPDLAAMATAMNNALDTDVYTEGLLISWLDPKGSICEGASDASLNGRNCNFNADCGDGLCVEKSNDGADRTHAIWDPAQSDAFAVIAEVTQDGIPVGHVDGEGDFSVNILSFCTTQDCFDSINNNKDDETQWRHPEGGQVDGQAGFVSTDNKPFQFDFSVATDGRDHWLSPGEPHCADCHAAPYTEQSGNINFFPPFNYPAKASLMRYSRGHQDITCQGCHESIHGLYPVTPTIDTTSYAQAAQWNSDDSHGPLKCGACHTTNAIGVNGAANIAYTDPVSGDFVDDVRHDFDAAVSWMHTYTDEADPRESICLRCHEEKDANPNDDQPWDLISADSTQWARHALAQRVSRKSMDKAEIATLEHVLGDPDEENPYDTICLACHKDKSDKGDVAECSNKWKRHLVEGRVSEKVWEYVSADKSGSTCGW